jgi:septal ring factor EnvC (AmiA/AmiB activator)
MDEKVASLQNDVLHILQEIKKLKEESITTTNNEKAINVLIAEYNNKLEEIKMLKAMNAEIYKEQLSNNSGKKEWIASATSMIQPVDFNGMAKKLHEKKSRWQF